MVIMFIDTKMCTFLNRLIGIYIVSKMVLCMTEYNIKVDNGDSCDTRITFQKSSEGGRLGLEFGLKLFVILLTSIYNKLIIIIHNTEFLCHFFHSMISEKKFV